MLKIKVKVIPCAGVKSYILYIHIYCKQRCKVKVSIKGQGQPVGSVKGQGHVFNSVHRLRLSCKERTHVMFKGHPVRCGQRSRPSWKSSQSSRSSFKKYSSKVKVTLMTSNQQNLNFR